MTFKMTRIKQRLADLEKGYKELCEAHDFNKQGFLLTSKNFDKTLEHFEELSKTLDKMKLAILQQHELSKLVVQKLVEIDKRL